VSNVIYRIPTVVKHLEYKTRTAMTRKDPNSDSVITEVIPLGWYVHFAGSYESLCVGSERPTNLEPGTKVDIIIVPRKPD